MPVGGGLWYLLRIERATSNAGAILLEDAVVDIRAAPVRKRDALDVTRSQSRRDSLKSIANIRELVHQGIQPTDDVESARVPASPRRLAVTASLRARL